MLRTKIFPAREVYVERTGATIYVPRDVCVVREQTFSGPMRKHGTEREIKTDGALARLDRTAHRRVHYDGPGYRVRRAR